MRYRYSVKIGKPCRICGEDTWFVYHGYNRCACGQYLWIERRDDIPPSAGLRLKYVQGLKLPDNYPGWFKVTAGGGHRREISEAQRAVLQKARAARQSRTSVSSRIDGAQ